MNEKIKNSRDSVLWSMARNRVAFKRHLAWYLVMNFSFWVLWLLRSPVGGGGIPWPVFSMVFWGTGLFIHFAGTYIFPIEFEIVKEFNRLKNDYL